MPDLTLVARLREKVAKCEAHLADANAALQEALDAPDPDPEIAVIEGENVNADAGSADGTAETGI